MTRVSIYRARRTAPAAVIDRVSANASKTKPAKPLAVYAVDTNVKELTTPFGN